MPAHRKLKSKLTQSFRFIVSTRSFTVSFQFTLLKLWHVLARMFFYILYKSRGLEMLYVGHIMYYPIFSYWFGHEPNIGRFVMRIKGDLAVDVGASLGEYTIRLTPRFKRILAIEPNPGNVQILVDRLKQRKIRNVEVVQTAISDVDGRRELYLDRNNPYEGASLLGKESSSVTVRCLTLDSLLKDETKVDLVKVDVESAEWAVLNGAHNSVRKIKRWMIELHDFTRQSEFDSVLRSCGYKTRWVNDEGPTMHVLAFRDRDS